MLSQNVYTPEWLANPPNRNCHIQTNNWTGMGHSYDITVCAGFSILKPNPTGCPAFQEKRKEKNIEGEMREKVRQWLVLRSWHGGDFTEKKESEERRTVVVRLRLWERNSGGELVRDGGASLEVHLSLLFPNYISSSLISFLTFCSSRPLLVAGDCFFFNDGWRMREVGGDRSKQRKKKGICEYCFDLK